jgi:hypothetical protein
LPFCTSQQNIKKILALPNGNLVRFGNANTLIDISVWTDADTLATGIGAYQIGGLF